jgi:hypothetical protein
MVKKAESRLQLKIRKALEKEVGGVWFKIHGSMFQAGIPDLIGCVQSLFFALEVKVDNGVATPLQLDTIHRIAKQGRGCATVVRSVDEAVTIVKAHLERKRSNIKSQDFGQFHSEA